MRKELLMLVLAILCSLTLAIPAHASPSEVPAGIRIGEGSFVDWEPYYDNPLITDNLHDHHIDFYRLWVTDDKDNIYMLIEMNQVFGNDATYLHIDADRNPDTGLYIIPWDIGLDFGMHIAPGDTFIGDVRDSSYSRDDFPGAVDYYFFDRWVELSFEKSIFYDLYPETTGFYINTGNDQSYVAEYEFQHPINTPITESIVLLGSGIIGLVGIRRRMRQ